MYISPFSGAVEFGKDGDMLLQHRTMAFTDFHYLYTKSLVVGDMLRKTWNESLKTSSYYRQPFFPCHRIKHTTVLTFLGWPSPENFSSKERWLQLYLHRLPFYPLPLIAEASHYPW